MADIFRMECFEQDLSYIVEGPNFKFFKQKSKENMPGLEQCGKPYNPLHTLYQENSIAHVNKLHGMVKEVY